MYCWRKQKVEKKIENTPNYNITNIKELKFDKRGQPYDRIFF